METIADCNQMQEDVTSIEQWMTVYIKRCAYAFLKQFVRGPSRQLA